MTYMTKARMHELINQIPGEEGWWRVVNEDEYHRLADQLLATGMAEEVVVQVLSHAYWAAAGEFRG